MNEWSLSRLLDGLHETIQARLKVARSTLEHPGTKGDASQAIWLELLQTYLPKRYQAESAHVVDSQGAFSDQMDVVVFDRQYSPFIFTCEGNKFVPAESVYAVFEAKQTINAEYVLYAKKKIASVRSLHRTSLPIPHAGGTYGAKPLIHIYGGLLTFESDWSPALGLPLLNLLNNNNVEHGRLDLGCIAAKGIFVLDQKVGTYKTVDSAKAATAFLFKLISELQFSGTVPMIDIQAYAEWLTK